MKRLLRSLILQCVRIFGAPRASLATRWAARRGTPRQREPRILLVRPDHLGDLVLTTPVLQALKTQAPQAHLTMMVGSWSRSVVERHPSLDRLITCPFPGFQRAPQHPLAPYALLLRTARQLRRERYDLAINLRPDFWWGAALLYLAGIPHRIGYDIAPGTPFLTRALPFPSPEHATVSNLRLASAGLQALGYPALDEPYTPARYPLQFTPASEERAWVSSRLEGAGINAQTPVVVIHPGTGGSVKLWRSEGWTHIANLLTTSSPTPAHIVLTGSPQERSMLEEIAQGTSSAPLLVTDASVGQLTALLGRAQLVLGVDSGPLHLAVSQDTLTLQIFGPTDARIFGPWGTLEKHIVIASTQRCATCPTIPCGRLDFRPEELPDHPCVRCISEQQVTQAITSLVSTLPSYPPGR
ncbi:MAG TPA: glycosyltransferase family 9 protein [Ktedonobacteraceae bacterium]|nr:glycosyltransferase family 9 protein [Ktedonobacteraceae bacterium]